MTLLTPVSTSTMDVACDPRNCSLLHVNLKTSSHAPGRVAVLFFGVKCIAPHIVYVRPDPFLASDCVWNMNVDDFIGGRHEMQCYASAGAHHLAGCCKVANEWMIYTIRGIDQTSSTTLNELVTSTCCNHTGSWWGNMLVFAHQTYFSMKVPDIKQLPIIVDVTERDIIQVKYLFRRHVTVNVLNCTKHHCRAVENLKIVLRPVPIYFHLPPFTHEGNFHMMSNEIVNNVYNNLPGRDLMSMANVSIRLRACAQYSFRRGLQLYLKPMLGNCVIALCDLLQSVRGALSGSCILDLYLAGFNTPFHGIVTIVVPEGGQVTLHDFLCNLDGYRSFSSRNIPWRYESLCTCVFDYIYQVRHNTIALVSLTCLYRTPMTSTSLYMCAKAATSFLC